MGNHTPGPWTARKESKSNWAINDIGNVWSAPCSSATEQEAEANAALIAAAPDLLAACEAAEKHGLFSCSCGMLRQLRSCKPECTTNIQDQLRAAIRKAKAGGE